MNYAPNFNTYGFVPISNTLVSGECYSNYFQVMILSRKYYFSFSTSKFHVYVNMFFAIYY